MKTPNSHYQEILVAAQWIAAHVEESITPTYQGYLADTAMSGHNPIREVVFNFLLEKPKEAFHQTIYATSEKDFKDAQFLWVYPQYKVFAVDDNIYLCNYHNIEMDNASLKEIFELSEEMTTV